MKTLEQLFTNKGLTAHQIGTGSPERKRKRGRKTKTGLDQSKERGWVIGKPLVPCPPSQAWGLWLERVR